MFINSLRKSPFSCSPGLILLGALPLVICSCVWAADTTGGKDRCSKFLSFNSTSMNREERQPVTVEEEAQNMMPGSSGGTVEWGPGLQQGAARAQ